MVVRFVLAFVCVVLSSLSSISAFAHNADYEPEVSGVGSWKNSAGDEGKLTFDCSYNPAWYFAGDDYKVEIGEFHFRIDFGDGDVENFSGKLLPEIGKALPDGDDWAVFGWVIDRDYNGKWADGVDWDVMLEVMIGDFYMVREDAEKWGEQSGRDIHAHHLNFYDKGREIKLTLGVETQDYQLWQVKGEVNSADEVIIWASESIRGC